MSEQDKPSGESFIARQVQTIDSAQAERLVVPELDVAGDALHAIHFLPKPEGRAIREGQPITYIGEVDLDGTKHNVSIKYTENRLRGGGSKRGREAIISLAQPQDFIDTAPKPVPTIRLSENFRMGKFKRELQLSDDGESWRTVKPGSTEYGALAQELPDMLDQVGKSIEQRLANSYESI